MSTANLEVSSSSPRRSVTAAPIRTLIVLNSLGFGYYGMERSIVETFDALRPEIEPVILIQQGAGRYRTEMFEDLVRRGFTLRYFSDGWDWPRIGKPKSLRNFWDIVVSIVRANRDVLKACRDVDFIYIPIITGLYYSFTATAWMRWKKRKVIFSVHDLLWERSFRLRVASWWVSDIVHLTQRSLEIAAAPNAYITRKANCVIPVVVDLADRVSGERLKILPSPGRVILFAGQVAKHKGIHVLLDAFRKVAQEFPDVRLHIAGGASYEYGEGDFQQALDATGLRDRIKHWGFVKDLEPLLRASYLYVQPSLPSLFHESFGRGAVEAMSVGVPTVCFRSGALPEIVQHEVTGLICGQESAECLAGALARLLSDEELRDRYSRNCLARYEAHYSKEQICRQWMDLVGK